MKDAVVALFCTCFSFAMGLISSEVHTRRRRETCTEVVPMYVKKKKDRLLLYI
jgi:hypothetical protein